MMKETLPPAGPDCAPFEDMLPLSAEHLLTSEQMEAVQAHVRSCRHCQAKLDLYARLDNAVRAYAGLGGAVPAVRAARLPSVTVEPKRTWRSRSTVAHVRTGRNTMVAAVATILITALLAAVLLARGVTPREPTGSVRPHPNGGAPADVSIILTALDMRTPMDGWAAGYISRLISQPTSTAASPPAPDQWKTVSFFLHYDGISWHEMPMVDNLDITSISMISADSGWAVGSDAANPDGYDILQYADGRWQVVSRYVPPDQEQYSLRSIAMVDNQDGWIAGTSVGSQGNSQPLLLHYQGGHWQPVPLHDPDAYELNAVTMHSASEGWAVGTANMNDNQRSAFILHYENGVWQRTGIGQAGLLYDVAEITPGNVWAVGSVTPSSGSVVLHDQNGVWQQVTVLTPNILHAVSFSTSTDGWIGGDGEVLLHWNGSTWANTGIVRHQFEITHMCATGPGEAWAIGTYLGEGPQTDLTITLLHFAGSTWRVYPLQGVVAVP